MTPETKFGSWTAPQSPWTIEYSLVVIEEIRNLAAEGYQKFSRGGIETGGVLYGTRDGTTIRILAVREIACEHALGPSLTLSPNDHVKLAQQFETSTRDPRLEGLIPAGWFVSHTRTGILLNAADLQTYSRYFPEPWQVTLVVRPSVGLNMAAGFFVRDADGRLQAGSSYAEFHLPDRMPGVLDRPVREPSGAREPSTEGRRAHQALFEVQAIPLEKPDAPRESVPSPSTLPEPAPSAVAAPSFGRYASSSDAGYDSEAPPSGKRRWKWFAASVIAAAGIAATVGVGVGRGKLPFTSVTEPLSLTVTEQKGQLEIHWNRASNTVSRATRGSLVIRDGNDTRTVALKPQDLATASFNYVRRSSDVEIRLSTEDANGLRAEEASRFLGSDVANADLDESDTTRLERDALQDEVDRLRQENARQSERIQQLQRTLVILRTRLGIAQEP